MKLIEWFPKPIYQPSVENTQLSMTKQQLDLLAPVSEKAFNTDPDDIKVMLIDLGERKLYTAGNNPKKFVELDWDRFFVILRKLIGNIPKARGLLKVNLEVLQNRISPAELASWLNAWRTQVATRISKKCKTPAKPLKVYHAISQILKNTGYNYTSNFQVCLDALDLSTTNKNTNMIALNVLINQLQFWLPVFSVEH